MTIRDMQNEILRLKKQNDILILAHSYQRREVVEVADFTGDSYALACRVANSAQKNVLMCGVRFMAETINILSPEKHVFLANENAGCPMAEQLETVPTLSSISFNASAAGACGFLRFFAARTTNTINSTVTITATPPMIPKCNNGSSTGTRSPAANTARTP